MNKTNPKPMFDFNEKYFNNEKTQMSKLRKFKDVAPPSLRKELIVKIIATGYTTSFKLESDGEYYNSMGRSLTEMLEMSAALGNSKVSIYAGK